MSYLARDLARHILMLRHLADDLVRETDALARAVDNDQSGDGWDEKQAEVINRAINDWGDNCERSIQSAIREAASFRSGLERAFGGL